MSFEGKVVLVTGGSSGIGAAVAIQLSKHGAKIAIVGRNVTKLSRVSDTCEGNGSKPLVIVADVTNDDDAKNIIIDTVKHYGKLDVLVNNVGIYQKVEILDTYAIEKFDYIMNTNLRQAVHLTHLAAPHIIETKGNIVNISSIGSTGIFLSGNFSYCTSKAGLDHFTRSVALELAPKGVRVNSVNPGPVNSDFLEKLQMTEEEKKMFLENSKKSTALGKISEPEEIANVVLFLASDAARSVTGSTYTIDNGMLLK